MKEQEIDFTLGNGKSNNSRSRLSIAIFSVLMLILFSREISGQTSTGEISITVSDPSNALVVGATYIGDECAGLGNGSPFATRLLRCNGIREGLQAKQSAADSGERWTDD